MANLTLDISPEAVRSAGAGSVGTWHDFVALLKPRVMTLVVFSAFAGLMVAPGALHPVLAATAILCVAVAAGGAAAINMWYDRDIDLVMERTRHRPIPGGRVSAEAALGFGVFLSAASSAMIGLAVNWTAAAVLALSVLFYVFVYTVWLKRRTPHNIVIGGAAGAFPPVIGWAAVTGDIGLGAVALFALIFMWTPPHFWALALYRNEDYARAGVPMLPVVAGERHTKLQMLVYTVLLLPLAVLPYWIGIAGPAYGIGAAVLGLLFVACALKVWREDGAATGHRAARLMFGYSIFYLFAVLGLLIADRTA